MQTHGEFAPSPKSSKQGLLERPLLQKFDIIPWSLGILSLVSNSSLIIKGAGGQSKQPVAVEERAS